MSTKKVAVITAAGRGMGAAIARKLHAEGHELVLMSPTGSARKLAEELGGVGLDGSVTEEADLEKLVQLAMERYGRIDVLVNNTGHPASGPLLELTDEQWVEGFQLLLLSVVRACRLVVPAMLKGGSGSIVNISAFGAFEPSPSFPISCTLRAGLASYSKLLSDRYANEGIRINSVLPGMIDSYPEEASVVQTIPMQRYGRVGEIADIVAFLASEKSSYITGQSLRADGGLTRSVS